MSLKSPLGRVLGLGSAGSGTEHFIGQRVSAIAIVPLGLWFAFSLLTLPSLDFYSVAAWAAAPFRAVLLILLVVALTYHSSLGTQVVAEDYISTTGRRAAVLVVLKLAHVALAIAGIFAVFLIATSTSL